MKRMVVLLIRRHETLHDYLQIVILNVFPILATNLALNVPNRKGGKGGRKKVGEKRKKIFSLLAIK